MIPQRKSYASPAWQSENTSEKIKCSPHSCVLGKEHCRVFLEIQNYLTLNNLKFTKTGVYFKIIQRSKKSHNVEERAWANGDPRLVWMLQLLEMGIKTINAILSPCSKGYRVIWLNTELFGFKRDPNQTSGDQNYDV